MQAGELHALRTPHLVHVNVDPELVVMGMLVDRRNELGRARTTGCAGCCWSSSPAERARGHRQEDQTADKDVKELVVARGSTLMDLHGIGPSGAARLLSDVGDIRRKRREAAGPGGHSGRLCNPA